MGVCDIVRAGIVGRGIGGNPTYRYPIGAPGVVGRECGKLATLDSHYGRPGVYNSPIAQKLF